MIVITLTDCPKSLRGDLSKWLLEINTGVFVGKVSARVRDNLWKRVKDSVRNGRATLVYTTNTEQRMDFRLHNSENQMDNCKCKLNSCFNQEHLSIAWTSSRKWSKSSAGV